MEDGLPDPVKAMGRILVENLSVDPKLALDAAWRLAQFTHHKKGMSVKNRQKVMRQKKRLTVLPHLRRHPVWW